MPALATNAQVTDDELVVELADGRSPSAPLVWFPRLLAGNPSEQAQWERLGEGEGIHWSVLDDDLSVAGLLAGNRSRPRPLRRAG
ncbi:MAG: DUF2442 domain-containing protein [bacterium]